MPTRIRIPERIPQGVAVAIEQLRIPRIGNDTIRLQEPPQGKRRLRRRRIAAPRSRKILSCSPY